MNDMLIIPIILAVGVAAFLLLHLKKKKKQQGLGLLDPPKSGRWTFASKGFPDKLPTTGAGWTVTFPADPKAHLNYVQWFSVPRIAYGATITVRLRVEIEEGGAFYPADKAASPLPTFGIMLQRNKDRLLDPIFRWFGKASLPLVAGDHTMTVDVNEAEFRPAWSDGRGTKQALLDALDDLSNLSLVFGSAGGRGHGVYAPTGTKVTLLGVVID